MKLSHFDVPTHIYRYHPYTDCSSYSLYHTLGLRILSNPSNYTSCLFNTYNAIPPVLPRLLAQVLPGFFRDILILHILFRREATAIDWGALMRLAQDSSLLPKGRAPLDSSVAIAKDHWQGMLSPSLLPNPQDE